MLLSSVVLYLTIRKSSIDKLPTQFNNLGIFLIPCVFYNAAAIIFFYGYHLSLQNLFIIVFAGVFFAYGCSVISLKSIEWAPNPGYSLMISKNYVVMTSFLAVPLFHQTLTLRAVLAILMIVGFSSLIMLNKKSKRRKIHGDRVLFAVVAFLGWGFLSLTAKYLYGQGVPPIVFLACLSAVGAGCIIIEMLAKKVSLKPFKAHASSFVLIGLASAAFIFLISTLLRWLRISAM